MSDEPLRAVVRLRLIAVDQARLCLAACLQEETAAERAASEAEAALTRERQTALDLQAGDQAVEAFAAWLPVGLRATASARARHHTAAAETAKARGQLAAARAAAEAAEQVLALREAEQRAKTEREAQEALEDASRWAGHTDEK